MAVNEGQNPLPIYLTVNLKDQYSAQDYKGNVAITNQ